MLLLCPSLFGFYFYLKKKCISLLTNIYKKKDKQPNVDLLSYRWLQGNSAKQKQTTWHWTENKISAFYSILNVFIYTQKTKYIWNGQTSSQQMLAYMHV